jgi:TnsA endonuclease N terminal
MSRFCGVWPNINSLPDAEAIQRTVELWPSPTMKHWTLKKYMARDPSLRPARPSRGRNRTPRASRATREIKIGDKGSVSGALIANDIKIWFESQLEYWVLLVLLARWDVLDVWEQPTPVEYVDDDGVVRVHTFDFLVTLRDGTRIAIAVKPAGEVVESRIQRIVDLIAEQMPPAFAGYAKLLTDKSFTMEDRINAQLIHAVKDDNEPEDDAVVAKLVKKLRGETTIAKLVEASGIQGYGFRAVVRAIGAGRLKLTEACVIDNDSVVARGQRKVK